MPTYQNNYGSNINFSALFQHIEIHYETPPGNAENIKTEEKNSEKDEKNNAGTNEKASNVDEEIPLICNDYDNIPDEPAESDKEFVVCRSLFKNPRAFEKFRRDVKKINNTSELILLLTNALSGIKEPPLKTFVTSASFIKEIRDMLSFSRGASKSNLTQRFREVFLHETISKKKVSRATA